MPKETFNNEVVKRKIIVPFTAAYLFPSSVKTSAVPSFHDTTDAGTAFDPEQNLKCESEIVRTGALGYVADGCGLQCVLNDVLLENLLKNESKFPTD